MSATDRNGGKRVVVVTGGGNGIGAGIAAELGRRGAVVVTMDPMLTVDGAAPLETTGPTTADQIVAAGGVARASSTSVTDEKGVQALLGGLVDEFGALDAVINVGGISRATDFAGGVEEDWAEVLRVHLDGYLNVLRAALPIMADAGHGRILGVTSGSGWRPANTGAYGCAKRAVASLTWQLGRVPPSGVTINALSPIAATRMVTGALSRPAGQDDNQSTTGGLSLALSSMPPPENLGPIGSYLASEGFSWCSGQVIFSSGTEVALIAPPRLLEVARSRDVLALPGALDTVIPIAFASADAAQATNGASNPRFGRVYDEPAGESTRAAAVRTCAIVTDDQDWGAALSEALTSRGVACVGVGSWPAGASGSGEVAAGFTGAAEQLSGVAQDSPLDAVVVARRGQGAPAGDSVGASSWKQILDEHAGVTDQIRADAGWVRAAADYSAAANRPVQVITITEAGSSAGRTRAQAAAQLARGSQAATSGRVNAFAVSVESAEKAERRPVAELVAHLLGSGDTPPLVGAELTAGPGWLGLRSHPAPAGSISFGGPAVPDWLDSALRQMITGAL